MRVFRFQLIALILALALAAFAALKLEQEKNSLTSAIAGQAEEVLYLPSGKALRFMSFGYRTVFSQLLWFNTISYFGKHFRQDQNYRWLGHMCKLVSNLDPRAEHVYLFCSTMLSWEANAPREALAVLNQGIESHPNNWYFHYLRGFNYLFFLKEPVRAKEDLMRAAELPGAEPFVARMAAKQIADLESTDSAVEFLRQTLRRTSDPVVRQALQNKIDRLTQGGSRP